ncbi:MAG: hypothetical protein J6Z14_08040 [Prevotella sp.]|nr:hypothetical protein [Prevotella sp.]
MRKKILMLLALFAGVVTATADNMVSVSSALIPQGKTGSFNIELTNSDTFVAFQMTLTLPEGITFESATKGNRYEESHSMGVSQNGQIVTFTLNSGTNEAIRGNSGALITVSVSADADIEAGTKLTATLGNMEFARKDETFIRPDAFDFEIEITDRVILDENSTVAPTAQTDKVNVLVKRTIKAGQWSTIVLPFQMSKANAEKAFGSDYQLAEFDSFDTDYGDDEENMTPLGIVINLKDYTIPARGGWAAGKPLLIKVSQDIESFEVDNVAISNTVADAVKSDEVNGLSGKLTGSFVKTTIPADGLFVSNNQFWYSSGKTMVKAFRCWFELDAVLDKETEFASRITINFIDDSETTGINDIKDGRLKNDNSVFNLQGHRINGNEKKGLYIVNGKKVIK